MKILNFVVESLPEDPRLDKTIAHNVKELSRAQARRLVEGGAVYINKKRCRMNGKELRLGDRLRIMLASPEGVSASQKEVELKARDIVFEDSDIIVVNKPPFLPTHETIDSSRYHLVQALQNFLSSREGKKPKDIYLGIHHRLDRDTSGLILFTKRKEANAAVAQAFQAREVQKTYLAICEGTLAQPITIKSFLGPSARNKRIIASIKRGGKFAETAAKSIARKKINGKAISLIEAQPKTGRTHQIRVHLSENQLPILGDKTYGVSFPGVERVLLHAWKLKILGKEFRAPIPDDFRQLDFKDPAE